MAKRDRSADAWEALSQLRAETNAVKLADALRAHLGDKSGVIIARAATLLLDRQAELEPLVESLAPSMATAFDRCMVNPVRTDPGCGGKIAVVNAGVAFHCLDADLYLRAIHHVQMEGSFGPPIDTAEALRGAACYGLLNCRHGDAINEIVELLAEVDGRNPDRFPDSRRGAIRALGTVVSDTSAALLRMTAHTYGTDPETLGEVFTSLNSIEASRSFDFIAGFLHDPDPNVADIASLALAEGKHPRACSTLLAHAKRNLSDSPQAIFTALAITRKPEAIEFLIDRLGNAREREAVDAINALQLMRHDESVYERVCRIIDNRGGPTMKEAIAKW